MIDLYYWPTPNGWKVTIMLEESGLPYTINQLISAVETNYPRPFSGFRPTGECR
jgi:GST-like protein